MPAAGTTRGQLNEHHMPKKYFIFDHHIAAAVAGMSADARVLAQKAQVECQSYRLSFGEPCSVSYLARHVSKIQQKYTITGGRRPFGVTFAIGGYDANGEMLLYTTDPAGVVIPYNKIAIGKNDTVFNEALDKNKMKSENEKDVMDYISRVMLETVDPQFIRFFVMRRNEGFVEIGKEKKYRHRNGYAKTNRGRERGEGRWMITGWCVSLLF